LRPLAAVAAVAFVLTACSGGGEPGSVATTTTTVSTTAPAAAGQTPARSKTFQMPSKSIGCLFAEKLLRCDILSGVRPEPAGDCDFDWVGLEIGVTGAAAPNCGSDTVFDQEARTLAYGSTWSRRGIVCESRRSGLSCSNREGHEFTLARGSWSVS
jgi:hypothetical protein